MTTPTTSKITVLLRSRESAERTIRELVAAQLKRETLIAARDAEVEKITSKHNPSIDDLTASIDRDFELLEDWAENNREEFGSAKSLAISGHRIGWRMGNPTVKPRGKLSVKTIVAKLIEAGGDLKSRFIREKPELNKEAILELNRIADGRVTTVEAMDEEKREEAKAEARGTLRNLGVTVTQTESFFFEPDREGQPEIRITGDSKEVA